VIPRALAAAALLFALLLGAGCVKPYQRELLAKPIMAIQPDPYEALLDQHMLEAREAAAGGFGSAGGGCGCN